MGIFGAKKVRAAAAPVVLWPGYTGAWDPDPVLGGLPFAMPGKLMNDDGCASDTAWCARYVNPAVPQSVITVCCYPSYAGADADRDGYFVGYRVCQVRGVAVDEAYTSEALRKGGVSFDVRYLDLDRAEGGARITAEWLMEGAAAILPPPQCLWEYFDWDGQPFPEASQA